MHFSNKAVTVSSHQLLLICIQLGLRKQTEVAVFNHYVAYIRIATESLKPQQGHKQDWKDLMQKMCYLLIDYFCYLTEFVPSLTKNIVNIYHMKANHHI